MQSANEACNHQRDGLPGQGARADRARGARTEGSSPAACTAACIPTPPRVPSQVRLELGNRKDVLALTKGALKLEVGKDAFHLETVWELTSRLKEL